MLVTPHVVLLLLGYFVMVLFGQAIESPMTWVIDVFIPLGKESTHQLKAHCCFQKEPVPYFSYDFINQAGHVLNIDISSEVIEKYNNFFPLLSCWAAGREVTLGIEDRTVMCHPMVLFPRLRYFQFHQISNQFSNLLLTRLDFWTTCA